MEWSLAIVPALVILLLHVPWVLRTDAAFEEAAAEAATKRAERLAAGRSRSVQVRSPGASGARSWVPLASSGRPAAAIVWKNVIALIRTLSPATLGVLLAGGVVAIAAMLLIAPDTRDVTSVTGILLLAFTAGAFIAAVAFATILAVVAGLTLASSSSLAHDFYANVLKNGKTSERQEVRVARISAFGIGAVAIVLSIFAQSLNVAFLVALAFAVAASGNLPAILYSLFWRRFNTSGAVWAIYGGLIAAVGLVFFSPVVSGAPTSMFPDSDWSWFPLSNPGLISIPVGFLCGWIGTMISKENDADKYAELEVRSLTGAGAH